eukprot:6119615-Prymnesium_polylepis.1
MSRGFWSWRGRSATGLYWALTRGGCRRRSKRGSTSSRWIMTCCPGWMAECGSSTRSCRLRSSCSPYGWQEARRWERAA